MPKETVSIDLSDFWKTLLKGGGADMGRSTAVQEDQRWSMKEFGEVSDKPQIRWRYRDQFTRPPGLKEDWINTIHYKD